MSSTAPNQTKETFTDSLDASLSSPSDTRELSYLQILLCAAAIGIAGGLITTSFYYLLEASTDLVWHKIPNFLQTYFPEATPHQEITRPDIYSKFLEPYFPGGIPSSNYLWIAATIGGLLVGLSLHFLGPPGEVNTIVDDVHEPGEINPRQAPSMLVTSTFSITAGGSLGPEAPLVQVIGSFGSWFAHQLKLTTAAIRLLTLCGMGAALAAFFGSPLGGPIFALELPHKRGLEFYEALGPAIISGILCFSVFRFTTGMTASGLYHFPPLTAELSIMNLCEGALLGIVGALVAGIFALIFRAVGYLSEYIADRKILLATLGGLCIGLIALAFPQTLFFSEMEIQSIIVETGPALGIKLLVAIALAKMLAISCTVHGGFRGGFIFPLFFVGAAVGLAISLAVPQLHPTIAMLCMMAAVNVVVTKTPISTSVILSSLSDTATIPVIIIASFVSFALTTKLTVIPTQRPRFEVDLPGVGCPKLLYFKPGN